MKFAITVIAVILAVQAFATPLPSDDNAGAILTAKAVVAINQAKDTAAPITNAANPTAEDCNDDTSEPPQKESETTPVENADDAPCDNENTPQDNNADKSEHKDGLIGGIVKKVGKTVEGVGKIVGGIVHKAEDKVGDVVHKTNNLIHLGLHVGL